MATGKDIIRLSRQRTKLVDNIINTIEKRVGNAQSALFRAMVEDFVDKLDKDGDTIKNTMRNKQLVGSIDAVYENFNQKGAGATLGSAVISGINKMVDFNANYFSYFGEPAQLKPINKQAAQTVEDWIGVNKDGLTSTNGYLGKLIQDPNLLQTLKDMSMGAVIGQKGFFEAKNQMREYMEGTLGGQGRIQQYYRNYVYDTFSQVDRATAKIYGDKLNLNYAIYEGGLIATSRQFCKERNGKVFSRDEIAAFDPEEAKPPGYDPFKDLGGYGCRHHLNWVPDAVAFAMRPELRNKPVPVGPAPVQVIGKEAPKRLAADTPFEKLEKPKTKPLIFKAPDKALLNQHSAAASRIRQARAAQTEGEQRYQQLTTKLSSPSLSERQRDEILREIASFQDDYVKYRAEIQLEEQKQVVANNKFRANLIKNQARSVVPIANKSSVLKSDKDFMKKYDDAQDFFRVAARGYMEEGMSIEMKLNKTNRDYALGNTINVRPKTSGGTIVHELAHQLERHNAVFKAAVDFLEERTAGKGLRKLKEINPAYRPDEYYRPGGFYNEYVGKVYAAARGRTYHGYGATEIISTGLERMFTDPLQFYKDDSDHFHFIYGLFFAP